MSPNLTIVVGARPNFIKLAPLMRALNDLRCETFVVHTGQHFSPSMSGDFFRALQISRPDIHLEVQARSRASQVAEIIGKLEAVFSEQSSSICCVVGDVTSTLAGAVAAATCDIPVAHIEAGLRSLDRSMPEEINRVMTDSIANWFFVSEPAGVEHLRHEGQPDDKLHLVGDLICDALREHEPAARERRIWERWNVRAKDYGLVTLHRPANVDERSTLQECIEILESVSKRIPLLLPLHPRTDRNLKLHGLLDSLHAIPNLHICPPLDYLQFLSLLTGSRLVLSDSGGIQLETTLLDIPCLTLRTTTERPLTIEQGTNCLVGRDLEIIHAMIEDILNDRYKHAALPSYWDGHAAERIAQVLSNTTHRDAEFEHVA